MRVQNLIKIFAPILKAVRPVLCVLAALLSLLCILLFFIVCAARVTALEEGLYQSFLETPPVQKKIDILVVQTSGIAQLHAIDESVYWTIFNLMKTELVAPFVNDLPPLTVQYLSGETNTFDPVINLYEVRGKVKWILERAAEEKIPFFLVELVKKNIDNNFAKHVPVSMRLLPLLGVTPPMEENMQKYVAAFQKYARQRIFLLLFAFVFALLWLVLMRKKKNFPGNFAASLGGLALCVALPAALFSRQLTEIAATAMSQSGRSGEEVTAVITLALPRFFERLSDSLFILAAVCAFVLLMLLALRYFKLWRSARAARVEKTLAERTLVSYHY
jgi:hypothetical protein